MARYAVGAKSKAVCDRCGFKFDYLELKKEWTGFKTCYECWEEKHPQLDPIYPPTEPQALFEPRPERKEPIDVPVGDNIFPFIQNDKLQSVALPGFATVRIT